MFIIEAGWPIIIRNGAFFRSSQTKPLFNCRRDETTGPRVGWRSGHVWRISVPGWFIYDYGKANY